MKKLSVVQAAEYFGVSKEAIYNRIRRGSLQSIMENNLKYVLVDEDPQPAAMKSATNDALLEYIKYENEELKEKISSLEEQVKTLQEQQLEMLRQEKAKIEQIYKDKDNQLKSILEVINLKQLSSQQDNSAKEPFQDVKYSVEVDEEIEDVEDVELVENDEIELKKYLKKHGYSAKKRLRILTKVQLNALYDSRIILKDSKIYIKPDYYDYSDLLKI